MNYEILVDFQKPIQIMLTGTASLLENLKQIENKLRNLWGPRQVTQLGQKQNAAVRPRACGCASCV